MELLIILHQVSIPLGKNGGKNKKMKNLDTAHVKIVGAHVKIVNGGYEWYIIPLCKECNARTDNFYVSEYNLAKINSSN